MVNVVDLMDEQAEQAERAKSTPRSYKPTFLKLSDGQKALFRPLTNLDGAAFMHMHNKFHPTDFKQSIDAACAAEIGKTCKHCEDMASDKKLRPTRVFFLPVYVYRVICTKDVKKRDGTVLFKAGEAATYTDENGESKPEAGVRLLKLTFDYGTIATAATQLKTRYREGDNLTRRDFSLERIGGDQNTKYALDPKDPTPFKFTDKYQPPAVERIRERVLEACPPLAVPTGGTPVTVNTSIELDDDIPEF